MTALHPGLEWLRDHPTGPAWLERLPRIIERCAERWSLEIGEPYAYATSSLVLRVTRADGTPAALKVAWPHREATYEADALAAWNGDGSVLLLEHDRDGLGVPARAVRARNGPEGAARGRRARRVRRRGAAAVATRRRALHDARGRSGVVGGVPPAGVVARAGAVRTSAARRGDGGARVPAGNPGRAGARAPRPARRQHPASDAAALARDRPEAAARRTRVRRRGDRPR